MKISGISMRMSWLAGCFYLNEDRADCNYVPPPNKNRVLIL